MQKKPAIVALSLSAVAVLGGCATVNPRPDYDRTAKYVSEATGQEHMYRPGDEEGVKKKVEELLADGLTADQAVQVCLFG